MLAFLNNGEQHLVIGQGYTASINSILSVKKHIEIKQYRESKEGPQTLRYTYM